MPPRYSREIEQPIVMGGSLKDQFRTSPCEASCPAGNPIQKMQSLVEKGRFGEALRYLRARNPFPGVTGRVCPHFCQAKCNRDRLEGCVNTRRWNAPPTITPPRASNLSPALQKRASMSPWWAAVPPG